MPRETEYYRDNLESLREYFGSKHLLSTKDVARYCGISAPTARSRFEIGSNGISLPTLARKLSRM